VGGKGEKVFGIRRGDISSGFPGEKKERERKGRGDLVTCV